jgi:hypothetical protein
VGLICVEIFGYRDAGTRDYAVNLGMALQLTNIIRDVAVDLKRGRIYLPMDDLAGSTSPNTIYAPESSRRTSSRCCATSAGAPAITIGWPRSGCRASIAGVSWRRDHGRDLLCDPPQDRTGTLRRVQHAHPGGPAAPGDHRARHLVEGALRAPAALPALTDVAAGLQTRPRE